MDTEARGNIVKRMLIHVGIERLDQVIPFYSALVGEQPTKTKNDSITESKPAERSVGCC
jgi:hypothetical protein